MHAAAFSPDRAYRYWLGAELADRGGVCMFLMLNPSRADETRSDATITRCKRFAKGWGFGTLWVCNLFALRSPSPRALAESADPVGAANDAVTLERAESCDAIICAWGNRGELMGRADAVLRMLDARGLGGKLRCIGLTKRGNPKHPLYLRADTQPTRWARAIGTM